MNKDEYVAGKLVHTKTIYLISILDKVTGTTRVMEYPTEELQIATYDVLKNYIKEDSGLVLDMQTTNVSSESSLGQIPFEHDEGGL